MHKKKPQLTNMTQMRILSTQHVDDEIDRAVEDTPQDMGLDDDEEEEVEAPEEEFLSPIAFQTKGQKNNSN